jgi:AcrR family transcriptional regulator
MNEQSRHQTAVADTASASSASAGTGTSADQVNGHDAAHRDAAGQDAGQHDAGQHDAAHHGAAHHEGRRHGDTRARIQQVALELFAEHGYDKTSLREIAERLDVTKAALYYHFKSKEDIVRSLVEDYFGQIDALIAWAKSRPRTPEARREILGRYVRIVADGSDVFRMLHHNQAAVNSLAAAKERGDVFRERMTGLVEALTEPGAGMEERLRATMLLGGVSVGWMFFADQVADREKLRAAVLGIATDLAEDAPADS